MQQTNIWCSDLCRHYLKEISLYRKIPDAIHVGLFIIYIFIFNTSVNLLSAHLPICRRRALCNFWRCLSLVFQFNLNIKCFVLSRHSIIVPGRLRVTDVANKQFTALEYKYPLWHQYSPLVKMPVIRRPQGTGRQSGWAEKDTCDEKWGGNH